MSAPALRWSTLPEYQPPLRIVPPDPDEFDFDDPTVRWATPPPVPLRALPDPPPPPDCPVWDEPGELRDTQWRLLSLVLEVLDGRRAPGHLRGFVTPSIYESLLTRRSSMVPGRLHRLRTLHSCRPARGVLELCATIAVTTGKHTRALAIAARVEQHNNRWLCTVLRPLYPARP